MRRELSIGLRGTAHRLATEGLGGSGRWGQAAGSCDVSPLPGLAFSVAKAFGSPPCPGVTPAVLSVTRRCQPRGRVWGDREPVGVLGGGWELWGP